MKNDKDIKFKTVYYQVLDDWYDLPLVYRVLFCWMWFLFPLVLLCGFLTFKEDEDEKH